MPDSIFIYGIVDPRTATVRYVGKSANPRHRFRKHLEECLRENRTHKQRWINDILRGGEAPLVVVLDSVPKDDWEFWEREWIASIPDLTNLTKGGEGGAGAVDFPPGAREKAAAWHRGRPMPQETRDKISAGLKRARRVLSPEHKLKLLMTHLGKRQSAETRAKISASRKANHQDKPV